MSTYKYKRVYQYESKWKEYVKEYLNTYLTQTFGFLKRDGDKWEMPDTACVEMEPVVEGDKDVSYLRIESNTLSGLNILFEIMDTVCTALIVEDNSDGNAELITLTNMYTRVRVYPMTALMYKGYCMCKYVYTNDFVDVSESITAICNRRDGRVRIKIDIASGDLLIHSNYMKEFEMFATSILKI